MKPLTPEERERAMAPVTKPDMARKQRLALRYHVEDVAPEGRPRRFLDAFASILKHTNYRLALDQYSRVAAKCSRCTASCHVYMATGDPEDVPCRRSEMLLEVYRRHFTLSGVLRGRLLGDPGLTDEQVQQMAASFYDCTACRRCHFECPMGIDHALVTHLARYILSEIGIAPRSLVVSTREQLSGASGNTSGVPVPALLDSLEFLSEEMKEGRGIEVPFPIDQEDAEYIFFPAVSDFLMEADTLMGNAAVFRATGDSWTIGTGYYDGINYGIFYNDQVLEHVLHKMKAEVSRLRARKILVGECGHASRCAKYFYPTFCGGAGSTPVVNVMEYTYEAWRTGRLKLAPDSIPERVTYHDPCNVARPGWIVDQPRELLRAICTDFVEMTPNRRDAICCGGGSGTVAVDELRPYRMEIGGRAKAEQIVATGAKICVAPCANCKKQLRELMETHGIDCRIVGLHDLIYKAIVFDEPGGGV